MKTRKNAVLYCMIICILVLSSLLPSFASGEGRLIDQSGIKCSESVRTKTEQSIRSAYEDFGVSVVIVITDYLDDYSAEQTAISKYRNGNYSDEGIIMLLGIESRMVHIQNFTNEIGYITDGEADDIYEDILPYLRQDNFAKAVELFASESYSASANGVKYGSAEAKKDRIIGNIALGFGIAFVISLIVVLVMKSGMKTVRPQGSANEYLDKNSVRMSSVKDRFLYSTLTKVRKPENNSSGGRSGGSGGGHSSGRGGHF